jgi:hypothetical protein
MIKPDKPMGEMTDEELDALADRRDRATRRPA